MVRLGRGADGDDGRLSKISGAIFHSPVVFYTFRLVQSFMFVKNHKFDCGNETIDILLSLFPDSDHHLYGNITCCRSTRRGTTSVVVARRYERYRFFYS